MDIWFLKVVFLAAGAEIAPDSSTTVLYDEKFTIIILQILISSLLT